MPEISPAALAEDPEDLYENAPCGYLSLLPDGTVARVNRTFLTWTGYDRADLVGRRRFQTLLSAGGRIFFETHYAPLLAMQGAVREIALDLVCADGRRLPVLVNAVLKRDADGRPLVARTTVFNATDRRGYEQELLRARREAETAQARVTELARRAGLLARLGKSVAETPGVAARARRCVDLLAEELACGAQLDLATGERFAAGPTAAARAGAAVVLPLSLRGRRLGVLALVPGPTRGFRDDELPLLTELAERVALGLENARLYERERHHALTLQRSLLGTELPRDPRIRMVTRYLPASEQESLEIGGDWYDAFRVGDRRVGVVVGDVVGRGIDAATTMGQLRSAVRAIAGDEGGPARVLDRLDIFVDQLPGARLATVAYAEVEPERRTVRYACAGHPPPAVISPGQVPRLLWQGRSPPLGVRAGVRPGIPGRAGGSGAGRTAGRVEAEADLPPGSRLLLYSDGLVERRDEPIDDGLDRLLGLLGRHRGSSLSGMVDATIDSMLSTEPIHDDVCALGAEV